MVKFFTLFTCLLAFVQVSHAQQVSRSLVASTGDNVVTQKVNLSFSIGEVVVSNGLINQGFQNSEVDITPVIDDIELEPLCTNNPEMIRAWNVLNPNDFPVPAFLFVLESQEGDSLVLNPGQNTFYSNSLPDAPNILVVNWIDESGTPKQTRSESLGLSCRIRGLILNSVCSDDPSVSRRWEIINRNPFEITLQWNVILTDSIGVVKCAPGVTELFTPAEEGENFLKIIWMDEEGNPKRQKKLSDAGTCESDSSDDTRTDPVFASEIDLSGGKELIRVTTFPNPFQDKLSVIMQAELKSDNEYFVVIHDLFGALVYRASVTTSFGQANTEINVGNLAKGIYVLTVMTQDQSYKKSERLVKLK